MSLDDCRRHAQQLFGPSTEVTDTGQLRTNGGDFQLPTATDTAMVLGLLYAKEHGPDALNEPILVSRHPNIPASIQVPFHALWDFQVWRRFRRAIARSVARHALYARIKCSMLPNSAQWGHVCPQHDAPHNILVAITRSGNPASYSKLRAFAENRKRLQLHVLNASAFPVGPAH
jgi:hypothetical protein